MFSRVPQPFCWSGPRENSQYTAVSRRDKSPGETVLQFPSGFFVFGKTKIGGAF